LFFVRRLVDNIRQRRRLLQTSASGRFIGESALGSDAIASLNGLGSWNRLAKSASFSEHPNIHRPRKHCQ